jgi:hypothetical protein
MVMAWVRILLTFWGVNGGVVHGPVFESLVQCVQSYTPYSRIHTAITLYPDIRTPISCMDPR